MNLQSISNQLLFNTVRLTAYVQGGKSLISTGFLVTANSTKGAVPLLITCAHALSGAEALHLSCVRGGPNGEPQLGSKVDFALAKTDLLAYAQVDAELDIIVVPFGPLLNHAQTQGTPVVVKPISLESNFLQSNQRAELNALEGIIFVGYPRGLYDDVQLLPLIRQGISATPIWSDFRGKPQFLIDAEVFSGSSGSPVFILNEGSYPTKDGISIGTRFYFVGMITQSVDSIEQQRKEHIGLGVVLAAASVEQHVRRAVAQLVR